ncbi:MAG: hypothetical protein ACRERU_10155 [Methylococcales bacterium]
MNLIFQGVEDPRSFSTSRRVGMPMLSQRRVCVAAQVAMSSLPRKET